MKAEYCVDYLSHQWNTDDLITTFKETCKQRQKYVLNNITDSTSLLIKNEKKYKKSEEYKAKRFQNALWRSMAKNCTNNLSKSNLLINPATVSWQKESDITWLYGPMYTNSNSKINSNNLIEKSKYNRMDATQSSLQGLKPVLKKQSNVTQMLPNCSDSSLLFYAYESTITTTTTTTTTITASNVWSDFTNSPATTSGFSSSRSSFSSVSSGKSNHSIGVHFNPEIIEIEFQPEYPVSLESSPLSCPPYSSEPYMNYDYGDYQSEDDEEDDDVLWSLLVQASESLKTSTYTRISTLLSNCLFYYNAQQQHKKHSTSTLSSTLPTKYHHHHSSVSNSNNDNKNSLKLILLLVSMMKSVFSLTTTWVLYQSLSSLSSLLSVNAKPVKHTSSATTTTPTAAAAGQSSSSKKARLIIL